MARAVAVECSIIITLAGTSCPTMQPNSNHHQVASSLNYPERLRRLVVTCQGKPVGRSERAPSEVPRGQHSHVGCWTFVAGQRVGSSQLEHKNASSQNTGKCPALLHAQC
jgi:hypothetical protein